MSKTILADVDGFTPCIDAITKELGVMASAVYGRVWRYCQLERGVCDASLEKIAGELGISYFTVLKHVKILVGKEYLKDLTPDLRNRPHTYEDTGKAGLEIKITGLEKNKSEEDRSGNLIDPGLEKNKSGSRNFQDPGLEKNQMKIVFKKDLKKDLEEIDSSPPPIWLFFFDSLQSEMLNGPPKDRRLFLERYAHLRYARRENGTLYLYAEDPAHATWLQERAARDFENRFSGYLELAGVKVQFIPPPGDCPMIGYILLPVKVARQISLPNYASPPVAVDARALPPGARRAVERLRARCPVPRPVYIKGRRVARIPLTPGTPEYQRAEQALLASGWRLVLGA